MPAKIDHTGKRFGRLLVIKEGEGKWYSGKRYISWVCLCDCGVTKDINSSGLVREIRSCGCLQKDVARQTGLNSFKGTNVSATNNIFNVYRREAKKRNFDFLLDKDIFSKLLHQNCYYCGIVPSQIRNAKNIRSSMKYNGIDRLNSSIGYTIDNCVTCCSSCNISKMSLDHNEFFTLVKKIYEKHGLDNA